MLVLGPEAGGGDVRAGDDDGVAGARIGLSVMDERVAARTDLSRHMVMVTLRDADERDFIDLVRVQRCGAAGAGAGA